MENLNQYDTKETCIITMLMCQLIKKYPKEYTFIQSYNLNKGIKKFGQCTKATAFKEMKQSHDCIVFKAIDLNDLIELEHKREMESLIFIVEKKDGMIKARTCTNSNTQQDYIDRDQAASPTAATDTIIITGVIDAKQRRDVMASDVPNAFVQTQAPKLNTDGKKAERIIMKIHSMLVDMLVESNPQYAKYMVYHNEKKVLYVRMLMALYGMLIALLLYYKRFCKDMKTIGFKLSPYDPCVANRMLNGKQHTIYWHVDDFHQWLHKTFGQDGIGEVKSTRGKRHDYLAIIFN
jgi:hypothetical protein